MLPETLTRRLEALLEETEPAALAREGQALSRRYREAERSGRPLVEGGALAYAASRMPATYEAIAFALAQLPEDFVPATVIDAGAGPGTATWAARERWPEVSAQQWEREPAMIALGQALGTPGDYVRLDLRDPLSGRADLVIAAYALNELPSEEAARLALRLWDCAGEALVLVDPGTPADYRRLLLLRERLTAVGACIAAPCPHSAVCPLTGEDWCHFACRVPRTKLHRAVKGGERGFEDEKFTYLVLLRRPAPAPCRILRRPEYGKGWVRFSLCTPEGTETVTVSQRHKALYRRARNTAWGDPWGDPWGGAPF